VSRLSFFLQRYPFVEALIEVSSVSLLPLRIETTYSENMQFLYLVLILALGIGLTTVRGAKAPPSMACPATGLWKNIPAGALDLYNLGLNNDTVNFDTLAWFQLIAFYGVDLGEFWNTVKTIEPYVNSLPPGTKVEAVAAAWNKTWSELAEKLWLEGNEQLYWGDNTSAATSFLRASTYFQLAGRFDSLQDPESVRIYMKSVASFELGITLQTTLFAACQVLNIPFELPASNGGETIHLHGYFCPGYTTTSTPSSQLPTIIVMNGYDGSAELCYVQAAFLQHYGYNLVVFDGPGQGATVRRHKNATFVPNFEIVTSTVLNYSLANLGVSLEAGVFVMGYSFGGYLAPRSFMYEPRFTGLIANGGISNFFHALFCHLPPVLQELYFSGDSKQLAHFDKLLAEGSVYSISLKFLIEYGKLGFGADKFSTLFTDMQEYYFSEEDLERVGSRPVLVFDPAWDTLTGNQSQIFYARLNAALQSAGTTPSPWNEILQLDPRRGTALHCAVGTTYNLNIAVGSWCNRVLTSGGKIRRRPKV
jgi:pimeloyl-ACP methyl ester carboxylesterase